MQRVDTVGGNGMRGWIVSLEDLEAYRSTVGAFMYLWASAWYLFRPKVTGKRIVYSRPDGGVSTIVPDDTFMILLRRGGVIRHMRVIGEFGPRRIPVFEGTGEIMGSMTEEEALAFLWWKDGLPGCNHWQVIPEAAIPKDRTRRNQWFLAEDGSIMENA